MGLGLFLEQDVRSDVAAGRLTRVLADWTPPLGDLCLYYPGRRNASAALEAFVGLARELGTAAARHARRAWKKGMPVIDERTRKKRLARASARVVRPGTPAAGSLDGADEVSSTDLFPGDLLRSRRRHRVPAQSRARVATYWASTL